MYIFHMCNAASMIHILHSLLDYILFSFGKDSPWCNIYYCALSDMFAVFCLFIVYYSVIHLCILYNGVVAIDLI